MAIVTKVCVIENCRKPHEARGWCVAHYTRWRNHGDPLAGGKVQIKHGLSRTPEYQAWADMIVRCTNPNNANYHHYGGRGITVCSSWLAGFTAFYEDVGPRPTPKHSLERVNVNGNYEPTNCVWATMTQQQRNRRNRSNTSSKYRGVCWDGNRGKWTAQLTIQEQKIYLGRFDDELEAAWMYDQFAVQLYGKDARTNFKYEAPFDLTDYIEESAKKSGVPLKVEDAATIQAVAVIVKAAIVKS